MVYDKENRDLWIFVDYAPNNCIARSILCLYANQLSC